MRILLDENLAPRLVERLRDIFDVVHVRDAGLASASDVQVWEFARESGRTIVTKDADFEEFAMLRGPSHFACSPSVSSMAKPCRNS